MFVFTFYWGALISYCNYYLTNAANTAQHLALFILLSYLFRVFNLKLSDNLNAQRKSFFSHKNV